MNRIKLYSRHRDVETIFYPIDNTHGCITTNGAYTRNILSVGDNVNIQAIDFEGGPILSVGDTLVDNKKIKSIKSCYYIELE